MRFDFTPEQEKTRAEVREFCRKEVPTNIEDISESAKIEREKEFLRKLGEKGWLGLAWPKEYGGQGWSHMEMAIFNEEMAFHRAPTGMAQQSVNVFGNTCIAFGNEEQKKFFIPKIVKGELLFCQGFSEPNAGSDLASLTTRAVRDGDVYVVNGSKTFQSNAQVADFCTLATRTDTEVPKHRGISLFIMPMNLPGITIRPFHMMDGARLNEIFLDDVRIPKEYLIGEENRGWQYMTTGLDFERSGAGRVGSARRDFEELLKYVKENSRNGRPLTEIPSVREKLARIATEIEVLKVLCYRVASMQAVGIIPNFEASMSKLYGSELSKRFAVLASQIMGMYGQVKSGSIRENGSGRFERMYKSAPSGTVGAGTSEIQKQIIAQRGLGLPR